MLIAHGGGGVHAVVNSRPRTLSCSTSAVMFHLPLHHRHPLTPFQPECYFVYVPCYTLSWFCMNSLRVHNSWSEKNQNLSANTAYIYIYIYIFFFFFSLEYGSHSLWQCRRPSEGLPRPHLPLTLVGRPVAKQKQEQESMQEQATEVSDCGRFKTVSPLIVDPLK